MVGEWSKIPFLGRLPRVFQSSLRDEFPVLLVYPALEALGYFLGSLRDPVPRPSRTHIRRKPEDEGRTRQGCGSLRRTRAGSSGRTVSG
jgi:hypothetical protein